ncbi:MAG: PDZ domain-containing protein [Sedimentisphaerales bacterium]|nr:PDZ domain-containing protein [Sedimentisphaerales bacterium]
MRATMTFFLLAGLMLPCVAFGRTYRAERIIPSYSVAAETPMVHSGPFTVQGVQVIRDDQPRIGVQLDPAPLPELLSKHLRLDPGLGLRILNVAADSPAEHAGLERDDIIIQFQDDPVREMEPFVDAIRRLKVGQEVTLQVIHLGERKTVTLELGKAQDQVDWKYPFEPEVDTWQPGRIFRLPPGEQNWMEIPFEQLPNIDTDVHKFFKEIRTYHHVDDQGSLNVTIEGDPRNEDSQVTVEAEGTTFTTTVGNINKLPQEYRDRVAGIVKQAARESEQQPRIWKSPKMDGLEDLLRKQEQMQDKLRRYAVPPLPDIQVQPTKPSMDHLQQQIEQLRKQMDQMNRKQEQMMEQLLRKFKSDQETNKEDKDTPREEHKQHEEEIEIEELEGDSTPPAVEAGGEPAMMSI